MIVKKCDYNGYTVYRLNGKLHCPNGPAIYYEDGRITSWWLHGKQHRYYGPKGPSDKWYIHGVFIRK